MFVYLNLSNIKFLFIQNIYFNCGIMLKFFLNYKMWLS